MQADGRTLDDKRDKISDNDISDILEKWSSKSTTQFTDRSSKAFFILGDEIRKNGYDLSIGKYKEQALSIVKYDPPKTVLKKLKDIETSILDDISSLEKML
jgi:type I restriction enzyme M protein